MSIICKRKRTENSSVKRKLFWFYDYQICKKIRVEKNYKRKPDQVIENPNRKKERVDQNFFCLFHNEKCVCDIYECSGLKEYPIVDHMPYII